MTEKERREAVTEFVREFLLDKHVNSTAKRAFDQVVDYIFVASSLGADEVDPDLVLPGGLDIVALKVAIQKSWNSLRLQGYFAKMPAPVPFLMKMISFYELVRKDTVETPESRFVKRWARENVDLERIRTPMVYLAFRDFLEGLITSLTFFSRNPELRDKVPRFSRKVQKYELQGRNDSALQTLVRAAQYSCCLPFYLKQKHIGYSYTVSMIKAIEDHLFGEWERPSIKAHRLDQMKYFLESYAEA